MKTDKIYTREFFARMGSAGGKKTKKKFTQTDKDYFRKIGKIGGLVNQSLKQAKRNVKVIPKNA